MFSKYKIKEFIPLIVIFICVFGVTLISQLIYGFNLNFGMRIFMSAFFLVFGFFKVLNLKGFAQAYSIYDLIAKRLYFYGYIYPFLEIGLGISYFFNLVPFFTNVFTAILMLVSALGVLNELRNGNQITCACLGVVFKIPMTYVTLLEDLIMALMALIMFLK